MAEAIFVGTTKGIAVLERNNGEFQLSRRLFDDRTITALASDPPCGTIYAGMARSFFTSRDRGRHWTELSVFQGKEVMYVHVERETHHAFVGTHPDVEVHISEDHGDTWRAVELTKKIPPEVRSKWMFHPVPQYGPHVKSIGVSRGRIYVNVEEGWSYRSDDGGASWKPLIAGGLHIDAHVIAPHPRNPDVVYSTDAFGACRSADGGETWIRLNPLEYGMRRYGGGIAVNPANPKIVLFSVGISRTLPLALKGAQSILFRSTDGGNSWTQVTAGLPSDIEGRVEALVFEDGSDPAVYAATDTGEVYEGRFAGEEWRRVASDLGNAYMYSLAVL